MSTDKSSIRRWPRYSLRTLFILVTLLACWLGYASNWAGQRHALLARNQDVERLRHKKGVFYDVVRVHSVTLCSLWGHPSLPWSLWLLGEKAHTDLELKFVSESKDPQEEEFREEVELATALFPEAGISWSVEYSTGKISIDIADDSDNHSPREE